VRLLHEFEGCGLSREKFCQRKQISLPALQRLRKKFGLMDETDAMRLKAL